MTQERLLEGIFYVKDKGEIRLFKNEESATKYLESHEYAINIGPHSAEYAILKGAVKQAVGYKCPSSHYCKNPAIKPKNVAKARTAVKKIV